MRTDARQDVPALLAEWKENFSTFTASSSNPITRLVYLFYLTSVKPKNEKSVDHWGERFQHRWLMGALALTFVRKD